MTAGLVPLRRLGTSWYVTLDGRYEISRQDGVTECEHPLCDTLHRKYYSDHGYRAHWVTYVEWHVWDNKHDDHVPGLASAYDTKREARQDLTDYLAEQAAASATGAA